jgi:hypothetical protein
MRNSSLNKDLHSQAPHFTFPAPGTVVYLQFPGDATVLKPSTWKGLSWNVYTVLFIFFLYPFQSDLYRLEL